MGGAQGGAAELMVGRDNELARVTRLQALGMTDVAANSQFTEYDADEFYIR